MSGSNTDFLQRCAGSVLVVAAICIGSTVAAGAIIYQTLVPSPGGFWFILAQFLPFYAMMSAFALGASRGRDAR